MLLRQLGLGANILVRVENASVMIRKGGRQTSILKKIKLLLVAILDVGIIRMGQRIHHASGG